MNAMGDPSNDLPVVALVRDLMFAGRIRAVARAAGVTVKLMRDPAGLAEEPGRLLIVDLNQAGAIPAAVEWKRRQGGRVIGFVAHTDAGTIGEAREAGVDQVMARSGFVESLSGLLSTARPD